MENYIESALHPKTGDIWFLKDSHELRHVELITDYKTCIDKLRRGLPDSGYIYATWINPTLNGPRGFSGDYKTLLDIYYPYKSALDKRLYRAISLVTYLINTGIKEEIYNLLIDLEL